MSKRRERPPLDWMGEIFRGRESVEEGAVGLLLLATWYGKWVKGGKESGRSVGTRRGSGKREVCDLTYVVICIVC